MNDGCQHRFREVQSRLFISSNVAFGHILETIMKGPLILAAAALAFIAPTAATAQSWGGYGSQGGGGGYGPRAGGHGDGHGGSYRGDGYRQSWSGYGGGYNRGGYGYNNRHDRREERRERRHERRERNEHYRGYAY
jgi:hypothetical protein